MIVFEQNILLIFYSELTMLVLSSILLYKELSSLWKIITASATKSLLGFLIGLWMINLSRIIGIHTSNIIIRTYLTALFAVITTISFINWGALIIKLSKKARYSLFSSIIFGMILFAISRYYNNQILELFVIVLMLTVVSIFMIKIMKFVFTTSPYFRVQQRLFLLTISFVGFFFLEAFAVYQFGNQNYSISSFTFLLQIPFRIGMTLAILLPDRITAVLSKII